MIRLTAYGIILIVQGHIQCDHKVIKKVLILTFNNVKNSQIGKIAKVG